MKVIKKEDVYAESLKYFNGDEMAANVWMKKYALKNNEDQYLEKTPTDMHHRLAKEFSRIEKSKFKNPISEDEIFNYFDKFKYIVPQGSPMSSIGNNLQLESTGNCYVIKPPYDSYGGIIYTDQQLVQLMKRRCGVGLDISTIRPKGTTVLNAAKTTDGIEIFMERYSNTCREVAQNGRSGAEIQLLTVNHPDILTFIKVKRDKTKVTGANLSVKITDEFMQAVKKDTDFELKWPVDSKTPSIRKTVKAKDIWNELITSVWEGGEPGVLFWDNALKYSLSNNYGIKDSNFYDIACNPCGEIIMGLDSCRLMVLNLWSYVENPFTKNSKFNFDLFSKHVIIAQRLMDDLIDIEIEQITKILKKIENDDQPEYIKVIEKDMWKTYLNNCKNGRRTGLGITALGDALAGLGITYASKESLDMVNDIYKTLALNSMKSSCLMAKELGAFPIYDKNIDKDNLFLNRILNENSEIKELHNKYGRRNISLTTNSPTGTLSMLTQTSSGIEPVFRVEYTRRRKLMSNETIKPSFIDATGDKWTDYKVYHHNYELFKKITNKTQFEDSPYYKSTANDIDWESSVELQAIAQRWISHSISKTVNIPKTSSKELIEKIYIKAWEMGCKGITIYRDKSRDGVLIENNDNGEKIIKTKAPKRPKELPCDIYHVKITKKLDKVRTFDYLVAIGVLNGDPYEVFAVENGKYDKKLTKGKIIKETKGRYHLIFSDNTEIKDITVDTTETEDALTRMTSTALRHGAEVQFVVEQLNKVVGVELFGFAKAIARALKHYIKENTISNEICGNILADGSVCNQKFVYENGCFICKVCGNSKCS